MRTDVHFIPKNGAVYRERLASRAECKYFLLQMDRAAPEKKLTSADSRLKSRRTYKFHQNRSVCLDIESRRIADASV